MRSVHDITHSLQKACFDPVSDPDVDPEGPEYRTLGVGIAIGIGIVVHTIDPVESLYE